MPEIGRIQSTNFQSLLTELGITRNNIPFALRSEVTPVVLVGGTVSFVAPPTPAYRVQDIFTAGLLTNPAAGVVLADTGPLPLGGYFLQVFMHVGGGGAPQAHASDLEWRDAANAANLFSQRVNIALEDNNIFAVRFNIENDNERFRVLNVAAPGVGITVQVTIMAKL